VFITPFILNKHLALVKDGKCPTTMRVTDGSDRTCTLCGHLFDKPYQLREHLDKMVDGKCPPIRGFAGRATQSHVLDKDKRLDGNASAQATKRPASKGRTSNGPGSKGPGSAGQWIVRDSAPPDGRQVTASRAKKSAAAGGSDAMASGVTSRAEGPVDMRLDRKEEPVAGAEVESDGEADGGGGMSATLPRPIIEPPVVSSSGITGDAGKTPGNKIRNRIPAGYKPPDFSKGNATESAEVQPVVEEPVQPRKRKRETSADAVVALSGEEREYISASARPKPKASKGKAEYRSECWLLVRRLRLFLSIGWLGTYSAGQTPG